MIRPMVFLIGAGPGDPGLISVRGMQCLASADVVLHDHLIHPRLLQHARPNAELIDVGTASPRPLEQEAICYLLVEKAREGKLVARLKWGDPFVFDHGGPEALFLHEQGVGFEVVPGIPAAVASPSYSGIPVTYPGGGDTLTFIRGHEDESTTAPQVDWKSLARIEGTLVCYAGPRQLPAIIDNLLASGRARDEAAALIADGTLPTQQTIVATLEELAGLAHKRRERRPSILVVGRVAGLREHLRWFDTRPLFGRRIVVTRPREQARELVEPLERLGAEAIEAPLVRIVPVEDMSALDDAIERIEEFRWAVFTSANAVDVFMERLLAGAGDVRRLKGVGLCTVGPATASHFARHGLRVDVIPPDFRAEAIRGAIESHGSLAGARVLWPRTDQARDVLGDELRKAGAEVSEITVYRTELVEPAGEPDVYRMLLDRAVDVVTFTSPSAIKSFVQIYGADASADLLKTTTVASIGPVTAEAGERYSIRSAIVPAQHTIPGLVEAIADYFARNGRRPVE
jgi:uroporphyrinogen III methyltransferase/synthase